MMSNPHSWTCARHHPVQVMESTDMPCGVCGGIYNVSVAHPPRVLTIDRGTGRIDRAQLYMGVADLLALRSTCLRGHVGALVVVEQRIVSTGYNGSPSGAPHCLDEGCQAVEAETKLLGKYGCQRAIHAELNAILWAARFGIPLKGGHMYSTHSPCKTCAEAIVQAGIVEFTYAKPYRAARLDILLNANIHQWRYAE